MIRAPFRAALALVCVAPLLGACVFNSNTQAAISAILANPANTSAAQVYEAASTLNPTLAAKVDEVKDQAILGAQVACGVLPAVASLGAIAAAAYGAEGIYLTASQLASAFCTPFKVKAASAPVSVKRLVRAPAPNALGAYVSRPVEVNGIRVFAEGIVTNPSLVH